MKPVYPQVFTSADLLNSTIRLESLIPFLQEQEATAVAITNRKLYGILPFYNQMKSAGIHPVIGLSCDLEINNENVLPIQIYAKTDIGYQNLMKISSSLEVKGIRNLPLKWLQAYKEDCIIVCSFPEGNEHYTIQQFEEAIQRMDKTFSQQLVGGISRPGGVKSEHEEVAILLYEKYQLSIIATHRSHYQFPENAFSYEVAQAISQGLKLQDSTRVKPLHEHYYLPTSIQWMEWFSDHPEWIITSAKMLNSCQVSLTTSQIHMPKFPVVANVTIGEYLKETCIKGLRKRLDSVTEEYLNRLDMELNIINQMGYADYFLIVADFMRYAKEHQILTGPGRGSSASSLVAYSLSITHVDPLKYGLLFERFLNPERVTMPDIDIDFADNRRQEVIQYVANKYGQAYVAQIVTFGTLSAKSAARDVARVFGFESSVLDMISKQLSNKVGISLEDAIQQSEMLKKWVASDSLHQSWYRVALELEGLPRHGSTHAAGVILSPVPLVELVPIEDGQDGIYLTQWPMQDIERSGLLKMDFLGLRNLTILDRIRTMIWHDTKQWLEFEKIPLNHEKTFELLQKGNTTGVFQLESDGMRQVLRDIKPNNFLDVVAINALYRPGPMDNIPTYRRRKNNEESTYYQHPILEPILKETYGVIVYQEQIMQIASKMAGFTFGEADILRRAVSKKNRHVLDEQRSHFVEKAIIKGFSRQESDEIYDLIVQFANYGFPKSHAVAYSLISYHMAYLKAQYPVYFYTSLLTSAIGNAEKTMKILQEIKQKKLKLLSPSIFSSELAYRVENGAIRFGLSAIKGVSHDFLKKLLRARKNSHPIWQDMFELAVNLSAENFSRKHLEPLIKSGALDDFHQDRATLLGTLDAAVKYAELVRPKIEHDLFEGEVNSFGKPKYIKKEPMPDMMKLQYERETLGFYMSSHPVGRWKQTLEIVFVDIQDIATKKNGQSVTIVGMIEDIRRIRTKKGESMAFVSLQDETSDVSCTVFPKDYAHFNLLIKEQEIVKIDGTVEWRQGKPQVIVKQMNAIKQ
ncbi:MAG: DNA polymerase III subunit alpha [Paenisporosarcina sp.]